MKFHPFIKYWLPVLLWMIFIFIGSGDLLSAEHTSRFIGPFLRCFAPDIAEATIASIQLVVRKCAHITGYAILAALLCRALRQNIAGLWRAAALAFVIAAVYGSLDEFHQSFTVSRTGSPWDVMLDWLGAATGVAFCQVFSQRKNRKSTIENRK